MNTSQKTALKLDEKDRLSNFWSWHFPVSFDQVYLKNGKRKRRHVDILSEAPDTIHSTTKTHIKIGGKIKIQYISNMQIFWIWIPFRHPFEII